MTPDEAQAFLASPSGVAAVEAGARALWAWTFQAQPLSICMDGWDAADPDERDLCRASVRAVLSAVLVAGLLIPKEDA